MNIAEAAQGGGGYMTLLFFGAMALLMYFMIIRPNNKRRREAAELQNSVATGDKVITVVGLHANVVAVDSEAGTVTLEISPGVDVVYERAAIGKVIKAENTESAPADEDSVTGAEDVVQPGR